MASVSPRKQRKSSIEWNASVCVCDLVKEKQKALESFDNEVIKCRRIPAVYRTPGDRSASISSNTRQQREAFERVRDELIEEVRFDFPDICIENLEAKAFRIFKHRIGAIDELNEVVLPCSVPGNVKRSHTGKFDRPSGQWSCCGSRSFHSRGCDSTVFRRKTWCLNSS